MPRSINSKTFIVAFWYFLIFTFLFGYTLYLFFPGFINEKNWQYLMVIGEREITNRAPPSYVIVWKLLIDVFGHASSMMIFNTVVLYSGLILTVTSLVKNHIIATILILFLGLGPYYLPYVPHYYKDISFSASLLLSFGLFLKARDWDNVYLGIIAVLLLFYALTLRHNALFAVFPVCLTIVHILKNKVSYFGRRTHLKGIVLFFCFILCALLTTKIITRNSAKLYPYQSFTVFDIWGISVNVNENLTPEVYTDLHPEAGDLDFLKENFTSESYDMPKRPDVRIPSLTSFEDSVELVRSWISAIGSHPIAYMKHRIHYFGHFLYPREGDRRSMNGKLYMKSINERYGSKKISTIEYKILDWYYYSGFRSDIKKPVVLFVPYLFILPWFGFRKWKDDPIVIGFAFSGFLNLFGYLLVGFDFSFRYAWWNAISLPLIVIYIIAELIKSGKIKFVRQDNPQKLSEIFGKKRQINEY